MEKKSEISEKFWGRKTICLLTGASQNLGRELTESMAPLLGEESLLILCSRQSERLGPLRQEIYGRNSSLKIHLLDWDFANPSFDRFTNDLKTVQLAYNLMNENFELGLLVHNASAVSIIDKPVIEMDDTQSLQQLLNINVISMVLVTTAFWKAFGDCKEKVIINVAGPLSESNAPTYGMLGVGRTSRKMVLDILSLENPEVKVLHFEPGHWDVSWLQSMLKKAPSEHVKKRLQSMHEENRILKADKIAAAFLQYLSTRSIQSRSVISGQEVLKSK